MTGATSRITSASGTSSRWTSIDGEEPWLAAFQRLLELKQNGVELSDRLYQNRFKGIELEHKYKDRMADVTYGYKMGKIRHECREMEKMYQFMDSLRNGPRSKGPSWRAKSRRSRSAVSRRTRGSGRSSLIATRTSRPGTRTPTITPSSKASSRAGSLVSSRRRASLQSARPGRLKSLRSRATSSRPSPRSGARSSRDSRARSRRSAKGAPSDISDVVTDRESKVTSVAPAKSRAMSRASTAKNVVSPTSRESHVSFAERLIEDEGASRRSTRTPGKAAGQEAAKSAKSAATKSARSVSGRSTQTLENKMVEEPQEVSTVRASLPGSIPVPDQPQNEWQRSLVGAQPEGAGPQASGGGGGGGGMDASAWDVAQTLQWLEMVGLGQFSQIFKMNAIDGNALMQLSQNPQSVDMKDLIPDNDLREILTEAIGELSDIWNEVGVG